VSTACLGALVALASPASGGEEAADRAALEKQLEAAREQLDQSAREVAELSRQLYGGPTSEVMRFVHGAEPRGSMLGVNIAAAGRDDGVAVAGVSPGGPAEQAGLRAGDVIVAIDGEALKRTDDRSASAQLVAYLRGVEPGREVKLDYLRDGQRRSAAVTTAPAEPPVVRVIRERLAGPLAEGLAMPGLEGLLGPERAFRSLELVPMTPQLGRYFGTDSGLLVVRVPESTGLPLEEGDVLQAIDGRMPESPGHAFRILRSYQPGEKVKLGVLRQRKQLTLEATLPSPDAAEYGLHRRRVQPPRPPEPPVAPPPPRAGAV